MIGRIALCAEQECLVQPELLGLPDVSLEGLSWLEGFSEGQALRRAMSAGAAFDEAWIVSAEDLSVINLAAALKHDGFTGNVCMVTGEASGSALSRATAAGVDEVYSPERFVQRFSVEMRRRRRMEEVSAGMAMQSMVSVPLRDRLPEVCNAGPQPAQRHRASQGRSSARKSGNPREAARPSAQIAQKAQISGGGLLVVVMGASGGVGRSTVAACLAASAALRGAKVLALDGDLQFGCLHRLFGTEEPVTFDDVAADPKALERLAAAVQPAVPAVLAAPDRLEHSETLAETVATAAAAATELFDVVVADTGANWSDAHAALMEMATATLFIIDQRAGSVRACQHALELCQRIGLPTKSFTFALNRCAKDAPFTSADVSCALGGVRVNELEEGGLEVEELCGGGLACTLTASGNAFVKSVESVGHLVLPSLFGEDMSEEGAEKGVSLFRYLGQRRQRQRRRQRQSNEIIVKTGTPHPDFKSTLDGWEQLR